MNFGNQTEVKHQWGAVYNDNMLSSKFGNCTKYNVLKNELNTCKEMENLYKNDTKSQ